MCVVTRLFDAILLRREGLSRNGLIRFFVPDAKSDIDAAARAPDMPALIQQKRKEGEAHVAKYGTKTSYGPLFGLAYSSPSRRSTSTDLIATRRSCDGRGFAPQWTVRRPIRALYPHALHARGATRTLCFAARRTYLPNEVMDPLPAWAVWFRIVFDSSLITFPVRSRTSSVLFLSTSIFLYNKSTPLSVLATLVDVSSTPLSVLARSRPATTSSMDALILFITS